MLKKILKDLDNLDKDKLYEYRAKGIYPITKTNIDFVDSDIQRICCVYFQDLDTLDTIDILKSDIKFYFKNGFSENDIFELNSTLARVILKYLKSFKTLYGELEEINSDYYNLFIPKVIKCFKLLGDNISGKISINSKEQKAIDTGMKLFSRHFLDLWI